MNASQLSSMNCSTCIQASLLSISTSHSLISKDLHPSGNVESWYLTPTNSHPCFAFSLTILFISTSVCFRITILIRPAFESKSQNFCSSLSLSIPHIHTIPPFAWQRCLSSLFTGCYWVRFHPLPSQLKQFFFTFVILQPLSETDEAPSMFYFHNIYILLIETQASISRMTLKKKFVHIL